MLSVRSCRDEAPSARPDGGAQGELALAFDEARQVDVGNVGTGDEKHEARGRKQKQKCRLGVSGERVAQERRLDRVAQAFGIRRRVRLPDRLSDQVEIRARRPRG